MRYSVFLSGIALLMSTSLATASDYPARSLEWVVPAPAGGGTDTAARRLATLVEAKLGQSIAVVNVAGGGGTVGTTEFASQADSEGYRLLAIWNGPLTTIPNVQPVQYTMDDFTPIISTSETAYVFCVNPEFPASNGEEFLRELSENPDRYTYGNDGVGGTMQLAAERIFREFDASATPVPFGGAGETLQNFLGGHIDIYGGSIAPVLPYVEDGQAKCLLLTSESRVDAMPDASSLADIGRSDLAIPLWRAILGPAGMPDEHVQIIANAVEEALKDEGYLEFLAGLGEWPAVHRGDALRARIENEYEALGTVAETLGLRQ